MTRRALRAAGAVALAAGLAGCGGGGFPKPVPAPGTAALPLVPGARAVVSLVTLDPVIGARSSARYRSIDVASSTRTRPQLIAAEVALLRARGWTHLQSDYVTGSGAVPVPVTDASATVLLDSPGGRLHVILRVLTQRPALAYGPTGDDGEGPSDPRAHNPRLAAAFAAHEAILDVTVS